METESLEEYHMATHETGSLEQDIDHTKNDVHSLTQALPENENPSLQENINDASEEFDVYERGEVSAYHNTPPENLRIINLRAALQVQAISVPELMDSSLADHELEEDDDDVYDDEDIYDDEDVYDDVYRLDINIISTLEETDPDAEMVNF